MKKSDLLTNPSLVQGVGSDSQPPQRVTRGQPGSGISNNPMVISLKLLATAITFGPKTIVAIPDVIVKALSIADGQEIEASITTEGGILLSPKGIVRIADTD